MWVLPHEDTWKPLLPSHELKVHEKDLAFRQTLADPIYHKPQEVHILLGVGFVARILDRKLGYDLDGTAIFDTSFGKVIMGEYTANWQELMEKGVDLRHNELDRVCNIVDDTLEEKLCGMMERLWKMDCIGMDSVRTKEQELVENYFMDTHYRDSNGRFVVKIPFKENVTDIGSSRKIALRRFMHTERRIHSMPDIKDFYIEQMREAIKIGHMREVDRSPRPGAICYHIPHHFVKKKPRVVFDASCKTNRGISLNDVQMLGEKLQPDLFETVMRLRRHRFVVCGDIKKMFNQIRINEEQWDCQRIFWREHPSHPLNIG